MKFALNPVDWVLLYSDYLLNFALFRLNNREQCEDLVQETFLSALKTKDSFKGESSEKTWLTAILKNKIIDAYRKKSKVVTKELSEHDFYKDYFQESDGVFSHWNEIQIPGVWSSNAETARLEKEYYNTLKLCLEKLPEKHAGIIMDKYFEEKSSEEICKDFELSKSNYWVIMHRAYLQLRKCLEKNWFMN